jgi:hypothetical protein
MPDKISDRLPDGASDKIPERLSDRKAAGDHSKKVISEH